MISLLVKSLYESVGNKIYLRDIEKVFLKINEKELTSQERQAIQFLIRDLKELKRK